MSDARDNVGYQRMVDTIDLIQRKGPQKLPAILKYLGVSADLFKEMRYGLAGRLALEDFDLVMPRPIASEGYVYKLASKYRTGNVDNDGEPNLVETVVDIQTRLSTIYMDVERTEQNLGAKDQIRKMARKLKKHLDNALEEADGITTAVGASPSQWSKHVLEKIS